jgi:hypothetical protein
MILNPATGLNPVFNFLDALISNYGVYLYLVFVWLSLGLLPGYWVAACGGNNSTTITSGIIFTTRSPNQSPPHPSSPRLTRCNMTATK